MAQEVQRQLEELEVKQKELEVMGVAVEKAIRGEVSGLLKFEYSLSLTSNYSENLRHF